MVLVVDVLVVVGAASATGPVLVGAAVLVVDIGTNVVGVADSPEAAWQAAAISAAPMSIDMCRSKLIGQNATALGGGRGASSGRFGKRLAVLHSRSGI